MRPEVAARWHPTRNGGLRPKDVTPGSQERAWWTCSKDSRHVWDAIIGARTLSTTEDGCPFCKGLRVLSDESFAAADPDLAAQWHPERNGDLRADGVSPHSNRKAWWVCPSNPRHVWDAIVANRRKSRGCPFCRGLRVVPEESLAALRPDAAAEWHPERNGDLRPEDVTVQSNKEVWWRCAANPSHEWPAAVYDRTRSARNGCPFCNGKRTAAGESIADLRPDVAVRWHPTKNGRLRPEDLRPRSQKQVWWRCAVNPGHEWPASVANMTATTGTGCPFCSGKRVTPKTNLEALEPDIAAQWHPTRNGDLRPSQISRGSKKKVWWLCPVNPEHEWPAVVSARTGKNRTGCPHCFYQSSRNELRVLSEMSCLLPGVRHREAVHGDEADVLVADLRIAFEYDGQFFHGGPKGASRDAEKQRRLTSNGYLLFRMRERPLPLLSERDVHVSGRLLIFQEMAAFVTKLLAHAELSAGARRTLEDYAAGGAFVAEARYLELLKNLRKPREGGSLAERRPDVAAEWHPTRNGGITPEDVAYASNAPAWWICRADPTHEWDAPPAARTTGTMSGCPHCARAGWNRALRDHRAEQRSAWEDMVRECILPVFVRMCGNRASQREIADELNRLGLPTLRGKPWTLARVQAVWPEIEALHGDKLPLSTQMVAFGHEFRSVAQVAERFGIAQQSLRHQLDLRDDDLEAAILHFRTEAEAWLASGTRPPPREKRRRVPLPSA
ncbi:zinc-ribbon domain-containing protein [Dankookia rubra]|nr:zinc-ribbon domain-containing protein [Dankookia rubra]